MDRHYFLMLTTTAQWMLFLAISMVIYARLEKRVKLFQWSQIVLTVLGIFSSWILFSHQIHVPDGARQLKNAPAEVKALTFFSGMILMGVFGILGAVLGKKKIKVQKILAVIEVIVGLFFFFMVYNLQKM